MASEHKHHGAASFTASCVGMRIRNFLNVTLKRIVECTGAGRREGGHSCGGPGRAKKDARHKIAAKHRSTQTGPAINEDANHTLRGSALRGPLRYPATPKFW